MSDIQKYFGKEMPNVTDYVIEDNILGGKRVRMFFENGFGVSVIRNEYSYGGSQGLFEAAVLNARGSVCYDNDLEPEGVRGWLTPDDVVDFITAISELPSIRESLDWQAYDEGFGRKSL